MLKWIFGYIVGLFCVTRLNALPSLEWLTALLSIFILLGGIYYYKRFRCFVFIAGLVFGLSVGVGYGHWGLMHRLPVQYEQQEIWLEGVIDSPVQHSQPRATI